MAAQAKSGMVLVFKNHIFSKEEAMRFKVGYVILGTVGQCSLFFDN